jgi:hypothetical protein
MPESVPEAEPTGETKTQDLGAKDAEHKIGHARIRASAGSGVAASWYRLVVRSSAPIGHPRPRSRREPTGETKTQDLGAKDAEHKIGHAVHADQMIKIKRTYK